MHRKVTENHLSEIFAMYGIVRKIELKEYRGGNFHRRATNDGIVLFSDETCAKNALVLMNDGLVDGKSLRIRLEKRIKNHDGTICPPELSFSEEIPS